MIDAGTQALHATIVLHDAPFPHHIYLSPDRARLALAVIGQDLSGGHGEHGAAGGSAVLVLDALTGETRAALSLSAANHNAIYSPDGGEIWTAQAGEPGAVLVLDAETLATLRTIPVGHAPAEVTFSDDGSKAFVANGDSDDVTVIDPQTKEVLATVPACAGPVGAWPGGDGRMYVDCESGKRVAAIDVASHDLATDLDLGFTPAYAATAPNGELWITDADAGTVTFWDVGTAAQTGETPTGDDAHAIVFAPDGALAYVTNQGADTVTVLDATSHELSDTIAVGGAPNGIAFRPF